MDFKDNQKIKAPRSVVFQGLLNPEVLKNSVPGCESAEFVDLPTGRELKLVINFDLPMLKGSHDVFIKTGEVIPDSRVVLITEPRSSLGSVNAACTVDLLDDPEGTLLNYAANATLGGKIAATPEFLIKPAVKGAVDRFFKNFDKQVTTK